MMEKLFCETGLIERLLRLYAEDKILFLSELRLSPLELIEELIENLQKIENIVRFVSDFNNAAADGYEDILEEIVLEKLIRQQIIKGERYKDVGICDLKNTTGGIIG